MHSRARTLNENQREMTQFASVELAALRGRIRCPDFAHRPLFEPDLQPDPLGDLLFTGIAQDAFKQNVAYALQSDAAYKLNERHTLRAGVFLQTDHSISETTSQVLGTDDAGVALNDVPVIHRRQRRQDRVDRKRVPAG